MPITSCMQCGAQLSPEARFCPHCGLTTPLYGSQPQAPQPPVYQPPQPYQQNYPPQQPHYDPYNQPQKLSPFGVTGFVLGIVGMFYPFLLAIPAIVFSAIAMGSSKKDMYRCPWMAKWGLGLGIASVIIWVLIIAYFAIWAVNNYTYYNPYYGYWWM